MSYHIKGARHRAAELLEMAGTKLSKEEIKSIKVIPKKRRECGGVYESVKTVSSPSGPEIWFETTELA